MFEIGVGENQLGRFSPEFERHRRDMARRGRLHQRADSDRAGEREMAHARMAGKRRARLLAETRHDVERAGGKAGLAREVGERKRSEAGFFRRLQDAGVAHRQRRADRPARDLHRIVPRHDVAGDAMRFAQRIDGVAVEIGDRLAHHLVGGAAVELHVARHRQRVGAALLDRLADIDRLDPREVFDAGADELGELHEQPAALGRGEPSPFARQRPLRCVDRSVDVGACPARDRADLDPARRVLDGEARAGPGGDPAPVDEALVGFEPGEL